MTRILSTAALAAALAAGAAPAHAQFSTLSQDAGVSVPSPVRLAQGDAYVASPMRETALFGNPAHLSFLGGVLPKVQLGVTAGAGGNLRETYDFYDQTLGPAIEEGLAEIRQSDPDRLEAIYNEALRVGADQKTAQLAAELSGTFSLAGVGVGVGAAVSGVSRARIFNGGAGIPYLDAYAQTDLLVPVGVAYKLPATLLGAMVPGLPSAIGVGVQGTYVQRWVTSKAGPVDTFDPDGERLYALSGAGVLVDVGLQANDVGLNGLDLGLAAHNVLGTRLPLDYDRSWALSGADGTPDDPAEIASMEARFAERPAGASFRGGVGYRIPLPPVPGVGPVRLMADYTTAQTSEFEQSFGTGWRVGARATLARVFDVRAGFSQGQPSAGASLKLPGVRLDYATHGVEDGALIGQQPRRTHLVQLRLGIF